MSEHTPGPWVARMQRSSIEPLGWIIEASEGRKGRIGWASRAYADTNEEAPYESNEQEANARLIAAAPDLLAALQKVVEWFDRESAGAIDPEWSIETMVWQHVRAAISKATGEPESKGAV